MIEIIGFWVYDKETLKEIRKGDGKRIHKTKSEIEKLRMYLETKYNCKIYLHYKVVNSNN